MSRKIAYSIVLAVMMIVGTFSYVTAQNFLDTRPSMQFSIPKNFGLLVTIYQSGSYTYFWFEAEDGTIRRVIMETSSGDFTLDVWSITRS